MYGRNFTGPGQRGGMGLGFRGSSPPWPYVGTGRGGLPRCSYLGGTAVPSYQPTARTQVASRPFSAPMSKEEELIHLKDQAEAVKSQLNGIEFRIRDLEARA
jgi:hypothetical protein